MTALLITGTDTDSGKTVLTAALMAYWQRYCWAYRLGLCKPVQSGEGDREFYSQLFDLDEFLGQTIEQLNPLWFKAPIAPPLAAALEGKRVDLAKAWQVISQLQAERDWVLVEGAGGLGSPITDELTVADIACQWRLPAVLVVPIKLGCISAIVANVALAEQKKIDLRGIVLSCTVPLTRQQIEQWAPIWMIESLTRTPVLGVLPHLIQTKHLEDLADAAAQLDLERLMPKPFWA
ncbi:dethiobiotin synthase [Synechococcus sp. PCC 7335]|uniref:dethiobiotin synthase n=1 Tax=Synechococcus sp. (strain ATCC 29403 / PCC 7335) TaxID=91464 RepID=UPI00017EB843|nr:dethiobiotin synthase [Synechococcus sp. PCC 7335]EDX85615.1 dethiobiotin synthase [Synechococcus sp. PCC 7335]